MLLPIRGHIIAAQHREAVGKPLHSFRIDPGLFAPVCIFAGPLIILIVALMGDGRFWAVDIGLIIFGTLLGIASLAMMMDTRLIVCERGVIVGRLLPSVPFCQTMVIRGRELDPGAVCVVSDAVKASKQSGWGPTHLFCFVYEGSPGVPGVFFCGPDPGLLDARSRTMRHKVPHPTAGIMVFASRRARRIAREMLAMIQRDAGLPEGFVPFNNGQVLQVSGKREDASQLPVYKPIRRGEIP